MKKRFLTALFCLALAAPAPPANAQETPTASVQSRGQSEKDGDNEEKTEPGRVRFTWGDHPSLRVGSVLRLDFAARVESDERMATPEVGVDQAIFGWRTPRVGVEGAVADRIEFELSRDLGDEAAWMDAYVNVRAAGTFQIEVGRFKVPFGRETLTGRPNLDFVYRSLAASELSPSRDVGVMTHGRWFDRRLAYQAGYFVRDGDNARTDHTRGARDTFAARVVLAPFAGGSVGAAAPVQIGVAATDSRLDGNLGLRGRTVFGDGVFFDRVYVNGRRHRLGLEAFWANGPVSLSSEYLVVSDGRESMGFAGEDLPDVRASAWYVAGTWAITGEQKHGRLEPLHALLQGGIGAVELVVRAEALHFDGVIFPGTPFGFPAESHSQGNTDHAFTLGINWYVDHYFRVQGNLVIESIADPQRSPAPTAGGRFTSAVVRMQVVI